jgi:hypothetical protein
LSVETFKCGHPRSKENTRHRKDGGRQCLTCHRAAIKRWRERNADKYRATQRATQKRRYEKKHPSARSSPSTTAAGVAPVEHKSKPRNQQPSLSTRPKSSGLKVRQDPVRDLIRKRALEDVITLRCMFCGAHVKRKAKDAPAWFEAHRERCKKRPDGLR